MAYNFHACLICPTNPMHAPYIFKSHACPICLQILRIPHMFSSPMHAPYIFKSHACPICLQIPCMPHMFANPVYSPHVFKSHACLMSCNFHACPICPTKFHVYTICAAIPIHASCPAIPMHVLCVLKIPCMPHMSYKSEK